MSARIESRLKKAERVLGASGDCACPRRVALYYEGEPAPSKACPDCGGLRQLIHVVFETPALKCEQRAHAEIRLRDYRLPNLAEQHAEPVGAE